MDYIVVGAGPGGCSCARTLVEHGHSVLLLERFDGGNNEIDPSNAETEVIISNDVTPQSLILGKGRGGGTNHHGLQYLDHDFIKNTTNLNTYFTKANTYINPINPGISQTKNNTWSSEIKSLFPDDFVENKVYSTNLLTRVTAFDILNGIPENLLKIQYKEVKNLVLDNKNCTGVLTTSDEYIECKIAVILAGGAIHTPRMLLRSNLCLDTENDCF